MCVVSAVLGAGGCSGSVVSGRVGELQASFWVLLNVVVCQWVSLFGWC